LFCNAFRPSPSHVGMEAARTAEQIGWPPLWIASGLAITDLQELVRATIVVLAKELATLDVLSEGRLEIGIGASHVDIVGVNGTTGLGAQSPNRTGAARSAPPGGRELIATMAAEAVDAKVQLAREVTGERTSSRS
jgi:hypothetical protein